MLPTDLKDYRAPSIFDWIEQEAPGILLVIIIIAIIADRFGWLV